MRWKNISINQIDNYVDKSNYIIIDVRSREEYLKGYIKGALNLPFYDVFGAEMHFDKRAFENVCLQRTPVIYCDRGGNSMLAAKIISKNDIYCINTIGGIISYTGRFFEHDIRTRK